MTNSPLDSMPRLTVVLPLKGRYAFTLRFLWHANRARLPYHFLVVDGQVHPTLATTLDDCFAIFPNITVEYVRYPDDTDLSRFYRKLADALARVRTPYAMLADNDDFICAGGTDNALDFLQGNEDYVAAAGSIIGFSAYSGLRNSSGGLTGRINRLYKYFRASEAASPLVAERLRRSALNLWIHYAVFRAEGLATICREIAEISFSDLLFYEIYYVMRALTLGKIRLDDSSVGYVRQYGTSLTASRNRNWTRQLIRGRFTEDIRGLVDRIPLATALADGCERAAIEELVFDLLEVKFAQFLHALFGSMQEFKKLFRDRAPALVEAFVNRPRVLIGRERAKLLGQLAAAGASPQYLGQFRAELTGIEDAVGGEAFAHFVRPYLPELHMACGAAASPDCAAGLEDSYQTNAR